MHMTVTMQGKDLTPAQYPAFREFLDGVRMRVEGNHTITRQMTPTLTPFARNVKSSSNGVGVHITAFNDSRTASIVLSISSSE